jgi:hypothetical protein
MKIRECNIKASLERISVLGDILQMGCRDKPPVLAQHALDVKRKHSLSACSFAQLLFENGTIVLTRKFLKPLLPFVRR